MKRKPRTIDAQELKDNLNALVKSIGRRKRITVEKTFELLFDAMRK